MKNILITGTSTGVGLESALLFARNGYKVYATMRNLEKSNELKEKINEEALSVEILMLDVTNTESIINVVERIIKKDGRIDVLLNNAGAGFAKTLEQSSEEDMQWVTDVNYHGIVRTTKAVIPYMRKQRSGHVINVSSVGGLVGQPFNELYCAAKFAVEGFTESLATYIGTQFNINFSLIEPGGISTEFMNSAVEKTMVDGVFATGEYSAIFEKYMSGSQKRASESGTRVYQTPLEVAQVILEVAQDQNPPLRIRTSQWAEDFTLLKTQADPTGLKIIKEIKKDFLN
jgi:NAD(P)-dependent dehydrogenase (short-subunit alcohol dehydrogenase family)